MNDLELLDGEWINKKMGKTEKDIKDLSKKIKTKVSKDKKEYMNSKYITDEQFDDQMAFVLKA